MKSQSLGPVWAYSEDDWGITLFWASFQAFTGSDSYPLWIRTWISSFLGLFSANRHFRIVTQCPLPVAVRRDIWALQFGSCGCSCSASYRAPNHSLSTSQLGHVEEPEQHLKSSYLAGDLSGKYYSCTSQNNVNIFLCFHTRISPALSSFWTREKKVWWYKTGFIMKGRWRKKPLDSLV